VEKDSSTLDDKEPSMFRLMKSEKFTIDHLAWGLTSSYRHSEIHHFRKFCAAHQACEVANDKGRARYFVLNKSGQEYYEGIWID